MTRPIDVTVIYRRGASSDRCWINHTLNIPDWATVYPELVARELKDVPLHNEFLRSGWSSVQSEWRTNQ